MNDALAPRSTEGLHDKVYKVALPVGVWLAEFVAGINPENNQRRFPQALDFYFQRMRDMRHDKLRYYTLEQYLEAFAVYLISDFGLYQKNKKSIEKILSRVDIDLQEFWEAVKEQQPSSVLRTLATHSIPVDDFIKMYENYAEILKEDSTGGFGALNLRKGYLKEDTIRRHPDGAADFCIQYNLTAGQLASLFRDVAKEGGIYALRKSEPLRDPEALPAVSGLEQLSANHRKKLVDLMKSILWHKQSFLGKYNVSVERIEQALQTRVAEIAGFCQTYGFTIIHAQSTFMYFLGGTAEALKHPDASVILVDEIPRTYVAINAADKRKRARCKNLEHKIYYRKHNYYEGIKVTDRPTYLYTLHEMQCYAPLVDLLLDGKNDEAVAYAKKCLEELRTMIEPIGTNSSGQEALNIPKHHFVWHSKSTDCYRAFEHGEKITFVTQPPDDKKIVLQVDELTGRKYFVPPSDNEAQEVGEPAGEHFGKEPARIYIVPVEDLQLDMETYYNHVESRICDLVPPIIRYLQPASAFVKPKKTKKKSFRDVQQQKLF